MKKQQNKPKKLKKEKKIKKVSVEKEGIEIKKKVEKKVVRNVAYIKLNM